MNEKFGWFGAFEITITPSGEFFYIPNLITDAGLNTMRDFLHGDAVDGIDYIAVGSGTAAPASTDTTLATEVFRAAVTTRTKTSTGVLDVETLLLDADGAMTIREIGAFCGGTLAADSGTLISRVLWSRDKTDLETIKIARTDTIARG